MIQDTTKSSDSLIHVSLKHGKRSEACDDDGDRLQKLHAYI